MGKLIKVDFTKKKKTNPWEKIFKEHWPEEFDKFKRSEKDG